jgi:hypothetical protein
MTIFHIAATSILAWLLSLAFIGAALGNALGGTAIQADFKRWGYPAWWNFVTATIELFGAILIFVTETRIWGLALLGLVMISALATLVWRREYKHLAPGLILTALIIFESGLGFIH